MSAGRPPPGALRPAGPARLPGNGGMEALASGKGVTLVISESLRTSTGAAVALVRLGGGDWQEAEVSVAEGFSRSEEHTSELQSLMRISYAVFCLTQKKLQNQD